MEKCNVDVYVTNKTSEHGALKLSYSLVSVLSCHFSALLDSRRLALEVLKSPTPWKL